MKLTPKLDPDMQKARFFKACSTLIELGTIYLFIWGIYTALVNIATWI